MAQVKTKKTQLEVSEMFKISEEQKKKLIQGLSEATAWNTKGNYPAIGEVLIGKLLKVEEISISRGRKKIESSLATLQTEEGLKGVWLTTVLESQFEDKGVEINDIIAIKYLGMVEDAKNPYHKFIVSKL